MPRGSTEEAQPGDQIVFAARTVFTQIPDWVVFAAVNDGAMRTWLALASHAGKHRTAFPGVKRIAKQRGKSVRQIFDHLEQLERHGLLRRQARYREDGGRTSTLYTLAWDQPLPDDPPCDKPHAPAATDRIGRAATDRTGPPAASRRPGTTSTFEPHPPTPDSSPDAEARAEQPQGAAAPRTPRSKDSRDRPTPRDRGTNPRAIQRAQQRTEAMRNWAERIMSLPEVSADDFREVVESELRQGIVTAEDAAVALAAAAEFAAGRVE